MDSTKRFGLHVLFAAVAGGLLYAAQHAGWLGLTSEQQVLFVALVTAAASFFRGKQEEN